MTTTRGPPRVAFVISGSIDTLTGGYIYDKKLVDYLRTERGFDVDVISLPISQRWLDVLCNFWILPRLTIWKKYELVVEDGMVFRAAAFANQFLKILAPIVGVIHMIDWPVCSSDSLGKPIAKRLEKIALGSYARIVVNSRNTLEQVRGLDGSFAEKSAIIYPGYDEDLNNIPCRRSGIRNPIQILYAGQVIPRKGLHLLLEALSKIENNQNWTLGVAGDLKCDQGYAQSIFVRFHHLLSSGRITFLGEVSHEEMSSLFRSSDIFVLPTMYEAFGMSILEAQVSGLPAVVFDVGGVGEIITDGVTGVLVPPFDANLLSRAIEQLIANNEYRERLSEAALSLKRKEFPVWKSSCEKFASCLDQILSLKDAKLD